MPANQHPNDQNAAPPVESAPSPPAIDPSPNDPAPPAVPGTIELSLPDAIPTRWLDDIKASVKESRKALIVTTILSSSLLTGFLTAVGTYYLEGRKTMLQVQMEDAKQTIGQYNQLRTTVNELKYSLSTGVLVFKQAGEPEAPEALAMNARGQIDSIIEHGATMKEAVAKLNDPDTDRLVEATLQPLTPALVGAKSKLNDKKVLVDLAELCRKSNDEGIRNILSLIDKKKQELSAKFYRL